MSSPVVTPPPPPVPAEPVTPAPPPATDGLPTGWRGKLLPVNTISGDGRMMVLEGDTVPARPLPIAFKGQKVEAEGHDGATVIGLITRLWSEGGFVMGEGPFDLADPDAAEWARKLGAGFAGWVSIDLSDVVVEEVPLDADGNPIPLELFEAWDRDIEAWDMMPEPKGPPPEPPEVADVLRQAIKWKVMGATMLGAPAFEDARVEAVYGEEFAPAADIPALVAAAAEDAPADPEHTEVMVALLPADPTPLVVEGGDPPEQLHMTLRMLGEATDWPPDARDALVTALGDVLGGSVDGEVFGHAVFNPNNPDKKPCAVYLLNSPGAHQLEQAVSDVIASLPGLPVLPDSYDFIPHITAGYGLDFSALSFTGPVLFDRLRVAFAEEYTDLTMDTEALAAAAGVLYKAADFEVPEPDEYVDHWRVESDGRVSMHLAKWGECHIGYAGACVTPPPGVADYARFHRVPVQTDQGPLRVGKITMGTGHASTDPSMTAAAATAHYDNTGTLVAVVRVHDGAIGPWMAGHLVPWATPEDAMKLAHHESSGDWRGPRNRLELIAALAVNVPGFMRSTVAASGHAALVAAGRPWKRPDPLWRKSLHHRAPVLPGMTAADIRAQVRQVFGEMAVQRELDERVAAAQIDNLTRRVGLNNRR